MRTYVGSVICWAHVALGTHVVHESRDKPVAPVRIGLQQRNLGTSHDMLMQVSDPASSSYGQFWSQQQVIDYFAPSPEAFVSVQDWLQQEGIPRQNLSQSTNKQWVQLDVDVAQLESLLNTTYYVYRHTPSGAKSIACDQYSIPSSVRTYIDYITPGIRLQAPIAKRRNAMKSSQAIPIPLDNRRPLPVPLTDLQKAPLEHCDTVSSPACLMAIYNMPRGYLSHPNNTLGIFEAGESYDQKDLNIFFTAYAPYIKNGTTPILDTIDGGLGIGPTGDAGYESALDLDVAYPLIHPQGVTYYATDDAYQTHNSDKSTINTFLDAIDGSYCDKISPLDPIYPDNHRGGYHGKLQCGVFKPTNVISLSYIAGDEVDYPYPYLNRQCQEYLKLGLQGVTVVAASADYGVEGSNFRIPCLGINHTIFSPTFPATCPYVTVVGETVLKNKSPPIANHQRAGVAPYSGGGFSNAFLKPSYQKNSLDAYFANHLPPYKYYYSDHNVTVANQTGRYNRIGRGFPDLSAIGMNCPVSEGGALQLVDGTSCSTPIIASMFTRINEERLYAGKSKVGFVNPVLYANPSVFTDIVTGDNPGCGTEGFRCVKGWDPVTGLGTPDYEKLLALFMGL